MTAPLQSDKRLGEAWYDLLGALARQPGALRAGLLDRAAASFVSVGPNGEMREEEATVRVLVEAGLAAAAALSAQLEWGAAREFEQSFAEGGLLIHCLDEARCLVLLRQADATAARLRLALREAAASLPPAPPVSADSSVSGPGHDPIFDEKGFTPSKSIVYNPFTSA